jgi:hypothetical protein
MAKRSMQSVDINQRYWVKLERIILLTVDSPHSQRILKREKRKRFRTYVY